MCIHCGDYDNPFSRGIPFSTNISDLLRDEISDFEHCSTGDGKRKWDLNPTIYLSNLISSNLI